MKKSELRQIIKEEIQLEVKYTKSDMTSYGINKGELSIISDNLYRAYSKIGEANKTMPHNKLSKTLSERLNSIEQLIKKIYKELENEIKKSSEKYKYKDKK